MELKESDKLYIQKNFRGQSIRQIAKKLGVDRSTIEKYLRSLSATIPETGADFFEKIPTTILVILLFCFVFIAFGNSLSFDFVWDDLIQITHNRLLENHSLKNLWQILQVPAGLVKEEGNLSYSYRPIQTLSYWVTTLFGGVTPSLFHLTNVLLQAMASTGLFFLFWRLFQDRRLSFWVASIFAVHPAQIAAVTYVSGRAETLMLIGAIVSFFFYDLYLKSRSWLARLSTMGLCGFFFFLALLTKEIAVVLPLLFMIYSRGFMHKKKGFFDIIYFTVIIGIYLSLRLQLLGKLGQGGIGELPLEERMASAFLVIPHYIRIIFYPTHLHMAYQFPREALSFSNPVVLLGVGITGLLFFLIWRLRQRSVVLFGGCWFWIFLIPILNVLVLVNAPMAEHWLYYPLIGFLIAAIAIVFEKLPKIIHPLTRIHGSLFGLVLCLCLMSHQANQPWKNEIALFEHTLKYVHYDPTIYNNLGAAYSRQGRLGEAERAYKKALEIDPNFELAKNNLAHLPATATERRSTIRKFKA